MTRFLLIVALSNLLVGCTGNPLQPATPSMMDDAENIWLAASVPSYQITVEVDRPGDRRRTIVNVVDDQVVEGFVSYYDFEEREWQLPYQLNEAQATVFTVPGLFETVRGALDGCERDGIHVKMDGEPPFPQKIVLGPVIMDGEAVPETKSTVIVRQFAPK